MLSIDVSTDVVTSSVDIDGCPKEPLIDLISAYRIGLADFLAHESEDHQANDAFAEASYRHPRKALASWTGPAVTFSEAVSAIRLARDADLNDDSEIVSVMVRAAWGYFETIC